MKIRKLATTILLVAASFTTAFTAGTIAASPASASVAASSHTKLWWDGQTCRQFAAWERVPDAERFRHLVQDAKHAGLFLNVDVWWWNFSREHHASVAILGNDMGAVYGDCHGSGGP